jgi:CDP-glucose 4,6-dehydratase
MGSDLEPEIRNEATNEIECQYLSSKKARTRLGWAPMFQLEDGLRTTIEWYRKLLSVRA